jgi:methyl-accepting chemotaxis protein
MVTKVDAGADVPDGPKGMTLGDDGAATGSEGFFSGRSVVRANFLYSVGFGILMGLVFPLYAELFAEFPSDRLHRLFCLGCVGAGVVVGLISFLISRITIVRIIRQVVSQMKAIAQGSADLSQRLSFRSDDSVGALVRWFNAIMDRIAALGADVGASCRETGAVGTKLADAADQSDILVGEVADAAESLRSEVDTLGTQVESCTSGVGQIHASAEGFRNRVRTQSEMIAQGGNVVRTMMERFADLSHRITNQRESADTLLSMVDDTEKSLTESDAAIGETAAKVDQLASRVKSIAEIAARINLLSMNASIQAARAGDAGKGFAVIATDIRRLAETTNTHAEEISDSLETVIAHVGTSRIAEQRTREIFREESRQISEVSARLREMSEAGSELSQNSRTVLDALDAVAAAYSQFDAESSSISERATDIDATMHEVSQTSARALQSVERIGQAAARMAALIRALSTTSAGLRRQAAVLEHNVGRFLGVG